MNSDILNPDRAQDRPSGKGSTETRRSVCIKKILAPLDFSKSSEKALTYACVMAARFQALLILLHVVEFSFVGSEFGAVELSQIEADMRENARKQLEALIQKVVDTELDTKIIIASGRPSVEIIETASDEAAELIIIATHGHSSLAHVILGSTVERVVRHAPCPVLVVRENEREFVAIDK